MKSNDNLAKTICTWIGYIIAFMLSLLVIMFIWYLMTQLGKLSASYDTLKQQTDYLTQALETEQGRNAELTELVEVVRYRNQELKAEIDAIREMERQMLEALGEATFNLETGNGDSYLWNVQYNAGGIKCGAGYCSYASKDEGYTAMTELLSYYVYDLGFGFDIRAIRERYCYQCGESDYINFQTLLKEAFYNERTVY